MSLSIPLLSQFQPLNPHSLICFWFQSLLYTRKMQNCNSKRGMFFLKNKIFSWNNHDLIMRPLLFITFPKGFRKYKKFGHWTSRSEQMKKKSFKNFFRRGNFTPFMSKLFQIWDHFFPLLFPKNSKNLKSLDNGLYKVG